MVKPRDFDTALPADLCPAVFIATPVIKALLDRLTHHCHIVETGNESAGWRNVALDVGYVRAAINCANAAKNWRSATRI